MPSETAECSGWAVRETSRVLAGAARHTRGTLTKVSVLGIKPHRLEAVHDGGYTGPTTLAAFDYCGLVRRCTEPGQPAGQGQVRNDDVILGEASRPGQRVQYMCSFQPVAPAVSEPSPD